MPHSIAFIIDIAGGSCAAGQFLAHVAKGADAPEKFANSAAVLASLLTAQSRGGTVRIYGNDAGCIVSNVWVMSD